MKFYFYPILLVCQLTIGSLGYAAQSFLQYTRNIYCLDNTSWPTYKTLKSVTGYLHYGVLYHNKEAIAVDQTCESLISECQSMFGKEFVYIQSGSRFALEWDTVKAAGVICQHRYEDDHRDALDVFDNSNVDDY